MKRCTACGQRIKRHESEDQLTVEEMARVFQTSPAKIKRACENSEIPCTSIDGRWRMFLKAYERVVQGDWRQPRDPQVIEIRHNCSGE